MTSTVVQEVRLPDPAELDSDGSSSEDRDARKRLLGEADSSGPKKRRKQSTPVRFPTSLMLGDHPESEEEVENADPDADAVSEGKPNSPAAESLQGHPRIKDENLNTEFRCQYCSQSFDDKASLDMHLECEHNLVASQIHSESQSPHSRSSQIQMKIETINQLDQSLNLVNVPNIEMKNLASPWLAEQVQSSQNQQPNEEWSASIHMMPKLPALPNFPGGLPQYLPLPPGFPLTDSSQIHRPNLGPAPMRIFNPDAYCDLCHKEFCNKYFLKTHKANKHGIYVDSPNPVSIGEIGGAPVPIYPIGQMPPQIAGQLPVQLPGNSVKLEPALKLDNNVPVQSPTIPCDVCQRMFLTEESLMKHKQTVHSDPADQTNQMQTMDDEREVQYQSPGAMEMLFKQEYGLEQEDSSFMPPPRHLSPQAIQQAKEANFSVERLRKLGVLNPDAFCEICCKEYCNKYFLRTHKFKRHGIIIQDEKPPLNPGSAATWHQVQTSPLNLIINESGNGSEFSDRSTDDHECNTCGIRFQTLGLYESHRQRIHPTDEETSSKNEFETDTLDQRSISNNDSISEDLQKLQTMILQLNGIENKIFPCFVCGKECDSKATLKNHMTEHGITSDEPSSPSHSREKSLTPLSTTTFCTLCEKEYPNQDALRKHISEDHKSVSTSDLNSLPQLPSISMPTTPTSSVPTPERKSSSLTPTSSYCEICNKELCNKYFMKTHMQRMHGIEIENGAQIGGVICNICNKELCSKYFLRVHKHNTHGIIEEGSNLSTNSKPDAFEATIPDDSSLKPEQLGDLNHRYFTHFTEVCPICNRRFRSIKWLKAHLLSDHGKLGVDKWKELEQQYQASHTKNNRLPGTSRIPSTNSNLKIPNGFESAQNKVPDLSSLGNQVLSNLFGSSTEDQQSKNYRCSYCNFTTTVLPFLFLHERSHTNPQENITENERILQCPLCPNSFSQPDHFHHHLLTRHQFPNFLSQLPPPIFNSFSDKILESKEPFMDKIIESSKDEPDEQKQSPRITNNENDTSQKKPDTAVQVTPQGVYKCAQCGFATANLNRIKKHIKKDHKAFGEPTESVISELSKILKEVANKHKVPASYAMPQDMNSNPEKTIMQPFLIEEQQFLSSAQDCSTTGGEESGSKRFAPALVYLPVKARVSGSLTASFTLSPA
ncbi:uncharacterized protein LOC122504414 [Leptopilina heterotoma]|uniref:uncharacterized protein LOC122504414 n=1 Tax=Leptopilina heterotoma TaxID=63436 RepID=UPI001CA98DF4|nr:uncharacterized protein LOC122504414 [Leptopilina heterotoma]XP_043471459.1 uncharacterized protein LOC122504414 [Leptopilina heterotoma]